MSVRKRTKRRSAEITVETDETVLVTRRSPARLPCTVCGRNTSMISPEEAARIAGASTRTIYAGIESGRIHFLEMPDRKLLVCSESLRTVAAPAARAAKQGGS